MSDLSKYKRTNENLLQEPIKHSIVNTTVKRKKEKRYTEKITINLTKEEYELLENMSNETGVPKTEIIRRRLKQTKLFE